MYGQVQAEMVARREEAARHIACDARPEGRLNSLCARAESLLAALHDGASRLEAANRVVFMPRPPQTGDMCGAQQPKAARPPVEERLQDINAGLEHLAKRLHSAIEELESGI